ncbi:MAG TPA: FAD/NAD(P)-binding protein [Polyangiaceae bacterium]|nr:FAD/NAD(P)-binding protein [Polyangiaceae bacterium]
MSTPTVAIIGAGFSGTLTAVHLLRRGLPQGLRVLLINRSGLMARGVAYGTRTSAHVLNVPAGRMSAMPDDEESFVRFARWHDPTVTGGSFVPRRLYGDYLGALLDNAAAAAPPGTTCERIVGSVIDIEPAEGGMVARVGLADGQSLRVDRAVLSLGNYAPAHPRLADMRFCESPRYVRDPWQPGALDSVPTDQPVLLIGTGLTMLDALLSLRARGVEGRVHALSRRALLPQAHRSPGAPPTFEHLPPDLAAGPPTALSYLRAVRSHVKRMAKEGVDWRDVIASLRPSTPALWQRLSVAERARFLRHLRPYWEVHRHRAAPEPAAALRADIAAGRLAVHGGRLISLHDRGDCMVAAVRLRGSDAVSTLEVSAVVNCTGPESDTRTLDEPLIAALRARGLLQPDALGLGVETSPAYALMDAERTPSRVLYYVGPFLKVREWEATAVPELRVHALRLAETLRATLS